MNTRERQGLLKVLETRFAAHMNRHKGLDWTAVQARLETKPETLRSIFEMEKTGGEPDVVTLDSKAPGYLFVDCSPETPAGRRSICYDREALDARKKFKPGNSALDLATAMGVDLLTEDQYRALQRFGEFDTKTSSWVKTPPAIRKLGGALFCDRRYDTVFVYHNGADSYYAARGFRGLLRV